MPELSIRSLQSAGSDAQKMQARLTDAVAHIAGLRDGRLLLRWLVEQCGTTRSTYPTDLAQAAWDAGRRSVGMEIIRLALGGRCAETLLQGADSDE
jgi:hypothetical protein